MGFTELVVARQPIFDTAEKIIGYELLYRPVHSDSVALEGDQMTSDVLLGALTIGIEQLVGGKDIFCNIELGILTGRTPLTLPPERTVVEILETVAITDEVIDGCRRLIDEGYRIALDDFEWVDAAPRLLELASIVKIDVRLTPRKDIPALMKRCREYGVTLLAEKVETRREVAWCRRLGFELFQGYVLQRPQLVRGRTLAPTELGRIQLALALLTDEFEPSHIEQILRREPGLVLQLLHLAAVGNDRGMRRRVRTVREALVLIGTRKVRQWIALLLLSSHESITADRLATALVRARMCEIRAGDSGLSATEFAFAAGLLSSFDLLLGQTGTRLSATLDVDPDLIAAAFHHHDEVGSIVAEVIDYEHRVLLDEIDDVSAPSPLDDAAAIAFKWAMPYVNAIGSGTW